MSAGIVRVAAAVVLRGDGQVLLAQRPAGKAYAGYWEFPGGKLEPGESPRDALARELREELGLVVRRAAPWLVQRYVYPHAHVELHFFRVFDWDGEPVGHDGQAFAWQTPGRFDVAPLLPANTMVLRALELPAVYGITMAGELGEAAFLARARAALERGLKLVQLREKDWPRARQHALVRRAAGARRAARREGAAERRRRPGARLGLRRRALDRRGARRRDRAAARAAVRGVVPHAGGGRQGRRAGARLRGARARCGRRRRIRARRRWAGTRSRRWPERRRCRCSRWAGSIARDLDTAIAHGAHGIALRRAAWEAG